MVVKSTVYPVYDGCMNTPVKRITHALHKARPDHEKSALDDMASHNLAGFFGLLFEIDQRLQVDSRFAEGISHED